MKLKEQVDALKSDMFPEMDINSQDIKELKDWEVGKTYKVEMEIEMVGKRKPKNYEIEEEVCDKGDIMGNFTVKKLKVV